MTGDILTARALNRATLERQLLSRRSTIPLVDAVTHLVGMQAQVPSNPYVGLWSRLDGFEPEELSRLLTERAVVRIVVMRATIHLVTADDCLLLRPLMQPVLDQELARHPAFAPALAGIDLAPILLFARELLGERAMSGTELRAAMAERYPEHDAASLAYACRNHLALVQVPPRGLWGRSGQVRSRTAETWLGRSLADRPSIDEAVVRYLRAFGPATPADVSTWSRLAGMREVLERLRPKLRIFRDERGRELFDLPEAPRPDPSSPAPPRFLPEYDNVLLSHADRSRFVSEDHAEAWFAADRPVHGSVLVDGVLRATWRLAKDRGTGAAMLRVDHAGGLSKRAAASVAAEGRRLLRFLAADATSRDVQLVALD